MGDSSAPPPPPPAPEEGTQAVPAAPHRPPDAIYLYPVPAGAVVLLLAGAGTWWAKLWSQSRRDAKEIARLNAALTASAEARGALADKVRREKDAEITALRAEKERADQEVQAQLREALDAAYAKIHGRAPRPPEPPHGVHRAKRSTRELLEEVRTVTGRFRREDLIDDTRNL